LNGTKVVLGGSVVQNGIANFILGIYVDIFLNEKFKGLSKLFKSEKKIFIKFSLFLILNYISEIL